jgi:hypothetical protein
MRVIDARVVNLDELKLEHFAKGDKFECNTMRIGPLLGAKDLGYSYDVVPPGKRSCPTDPIAADSSVCLQQPQPQLALQHFAVAVLR